MSTPRDRYRGVLELGRPGRRRGQAVLVRSDVAYRAGAGTASLARPVLPPQLLRSPSSDSAAGSRTPQTTVASIRTAAAMPTPRIFSSISGRVRKIEKTATMISAALMTTPALVAMPAVIASCGGGLARPFPRPDHDRSRPSSATTCGLLVSYGPFPYWRPLATGGAVWKLVPGFLQPTIPAV